MTKGPPRPTTPQANPHPPAAPTFDHKRQRLQKQEEGGE